MNAVHILLVDDEERFVLNLGRLMKARGFVVFTAFDGRGALELLASEKEIAVVVLDVRMPGMDGIGTLQQIKERHPDIEVIMLTGQATLEDGIQAVRLGAFDYLQKPCDIEDLEAKVRAACSVEQIKRHPVLWPRSTAGEIILSGFLPLFPEDTIDSALKIFTRYRNGDGAQMLFVVDTNQRIRGMIAKRDMITALETEYAGETVTWEWICRNPHRLPPIPVSRIMCREVETVSTDTSLIETARRMLQHHYDSMPVVSGEAVLGIVRLRDVLLYLQAAGEEDAL